MITGVEHIAVFANDPESLRDWYARVFEFRIVKENDAKGTFWLQAPDGMLFELKRAEKSSTDRHEKLSGINHFALETDRFDDAVALLKAEAVDVLMEPTISATGGSTFFFRDPEGNIVQLIYRSQPFF